jgi:hypothetical protein
VRYTITIADDVDAKLRERARATGTPADVYLQQIVQSVLDQPTLREILAPVHQEYVKSGMSEGDLDLILSDAMDESRRERHSRRRA